MSPPAPLPGRELGSDRPVMAETLPLGPLAPDPTGGARRLGRGGGNAPAPRPCGAGTGQRQARRDNPEAHDQTFPSTAATVYSPGASNAKDTAMTEFAYDHVHLRSPDPDETARYYERMFGAEVVKSVQSDGRER